MTDDPSGATHYYQAIKYDKITRKIKGKMTIYIMNQRIKHNTRRQTFLSKNEDMKYNIDNYSY